MIIKLLNSDLNLLKEKKKAELDASYEATMIGGFPSSGLGVAHTYPADFTAMVYFNATMHRFTNDPTYTSVNQKTLDAGFLAHSKSQFIQVFNDGHAFGVAQDNKLHGLLNDVDLATTPDQISAVTW